MNHSQAQAILEAGGLSHLMEAAAALARLTGHSQITAHGERIGNTMPQASATPMMMPPVSSLQQQHHHNIQQTLNSQSQTESRNLMQHPNVIVDDENVKQSSQISKTDLLLIKGISSGGSKEIFPERLMALLNDTSLSEVITWLPHGRSFVIIRPDVFTESVLPKYFPPVDSRSSSKYTSFTRKLNRWGFRQATRGADTGAFHHPLFRRDKPELCLDMVCQRFGGGGGGDKSSDKAGNSKKRNSPKATAKVTILTKEVLQQLSPELPKPTANATTTEPKTQTAVTVSDDGRSTSSNNTDSNVLKVSEPTTNENSLTSSCCQSATSSTAYVSGITNDAELTRAALLKRNETERLRAAKAMLYESYCRAIRGE